MMFRFCLRLTNTLSRETRAVCPTCTKFLYDFACVDRMRLLSLGYVLNTAHQLFSAPVAVAFFCCVTEVD